LAGCLAPGFKLLLLITDAIARGTGHGWSTSGVPVGTEYYGKRCWRSCYSWYHWCTPSKKRARSRQRFWGRSTWTIPWGNSGQEHCICLLLVTIGPPPDTYGTLIVPAQRPQHPL